MPAGLLLAGVAATYITLTYKPDYRADALIIVEDSAPYIAFSGSGVGGNTRKYVETQVELLRSSVVLGPVLARPEIAQLEEISQGIDSLETLQKKLSISRVGGSELYKVAYTSKLPQAAADVANAVVAEYLSIQSDEEFNRTQRVIDLLEEERRRRSLDVERLRQRVIELAKDVTGRDPFARDSILDMTRANNPSTTLYQELAAAGREARIARSRTFCLSRIIDQRVRSRRKVGAPRFGGRKCISKSSNGARKPKHYCRVARQNDLDRSQ